MQCNYHARPLVETAPRVGLVTLPAPIPSPPPSDPPTYIMYHRETVVCIYMHKRGVLGC